MPYKFDLMNYHTNSNTNLVEYSDRVEKFFIRARKKVCKEFGRG